MAHPQACSLRVASYPLAGGDTSRPAKPDLRCLLESPANGALHTAAGHRAEDKAPKGPARKHARGFTLIELLVAISIMAVMAVLGWRGIDGMARAQASTQARADEVLTLQAALGQWNADLDAMMQIPQTQPLDWDGRALRITRRSSQPGDVGPRVVAWSRRTVDGGGIWLRWQSPALTSRGEWQQAWARAAAWAQNPGEAERRDEVSILPLDAWQLFYFRSNAWSNPLSSAGTQTNTATTTAVPDGVRLVLDLPAGRSLTGRITRDWVRPTLGGGKS